MSHDSSVSVVAFDDGDLDYVAEHDWRLRSNAVLKPSHKQVAVYFGRLFALLVLVLGFVQQVRVFEFGCHVYERVHIVVHLNHVWLDLELYWACVLGLNHLVPLAKRR